MHDKRASVIVESSLYERACRLLGTQIPYSHSAEGHGDSGRKITYELEVFENSDCRFRVERRSPAGCRVHREIALECRRYR